MKELLRKKSVKISLLLILLLIVMGIVGINVRSSQKDKEYKAHIAAAEKYLSDLDYEQAIAEYTKALEIDPKEEVVDALAQAYLDYAKSYADTGDYEKAASILEESYEKINPKEEVAEALEQAYLAYAQIYIEAGDYEKAVSILKEKSERTGWESLQNMVVEVTELQEQKRIEEEQKASGMVEFPFQLADITIMGYDLLEDHFAQLAELIRVEEEWYSGDGEYYECGHVDLDGWSYEISVSTQGHDNTVLKRMYVSNEMKIWYYFISYGSNGLPSARLDIESHGAGHVFDYAGINVPVTAGETYEDWCRVMQIDQIKENNLQPEERDGVFGIWIDDVCIYETTSWLGESWYFSTERYRGTYAEYDNEDGSRICDIDYIRAGVNEARKESLLNSIQATINADGIIESISYFGWPIAE